MPSHPQSDPVDHSVDPGTYRITAAPTSHTDDLGIRYRKYVISMVIRTACFLLFVLIQHWVRWFFVAGAVFLPYIAVVLANAGRESQGPPPQSFEMPAEQVRQLPAIEAHVTNIQPGQRGGGAGS